ncbi:hypothetical protein [Burkholderia sp. PAMC 26561]|uniref:hypothetical protein n=1 Tax=Burkholderia sp. PAMC 26561 TaxID=1795043 RepID=UPI0013C49DB5|nr:hypothetical protein [Burkholderia sp. PAMC 26561]
MKPLLEMEAVKTWSPLYNHNNTSQPDLFMCLRAIESYAQQASGGWPWAFRGLFQDQGLSLMNLGKAEVAKLFFRRKGSSSLDPSLAIGNNGWKAKPIQGSGLAHYRQ